MLARVQYLLDGRLFEWSFSLGTLWLAVGTLVWPEMIVEGAFKRLTDYMQPGTVAGYALGISLCGMLALASNGRSVVVGPVVRGICAVGRAHLWSQMAYALYLYSLENPAPSLGLGFWIIFACAEFYVAYRAMGDVQRNL